MPLGFLQWPTTRALGKAGFRVITKKVFSKSDVQKFIKSIPGYQASF
jgi:hypothetical protein